MAAKEAGGGHRSVKLFIRNKADDFIAELNVAGGTPEEVSSSLPEKIVLTGFTRDAAVLRGESGPEQKGLVPTLVTLTCGDAKDREVRKFREFLCGRKKAATSTSGGAAVPLIVVLPRDTSTTGELTAVVYRPKPAPAAAAAAAAAAPAPAASKKMPSWAPKSLDSPKRKLPSWGPGAMKRTSSAGASGGAAGGTGGAAAGKKRRMATMAEKIALGSQQYRDLGPDETLRLPDLISWDTDRMVLMDPVSGRCVYYQDKGKKYRFITDAAEGMPLLCDLVTTNRTLLRKNEEIMVQVRRRKTPRGSCARKSTTQFTKTGSGQTRTKSARMTVLFFVAWQP